MAGGGTTLEYTPTWVVAVVCTVIVIISLSVERLLHYLGKACQLYIYNLSSLSYTFMPKFDASIILFLHLQLFPFFTALEEEKTETSF